MKSSLSHQKPQEIQLWTGTRPAPGRSLTPLLIMTFLFSEMLCSLRYLEGLRQISAITSETECGLELMIPAIHGVSAQEPNRIDSSCPFLALYILTCHHHNYEYATSLGRTISTFPLSSLFWCIFLIFCLSVTFESQKCLAGAVFKQCTPERYFIPDPTSP